MPEPMRDLSFRDIEGLAERLLISTKDLLYAEREDFCNPSPCWWRIHHRRCCKKRAYLLGNPLLPYEFLFGNAAH